MSWWYNFPSVPACVRGSDVTQAQAEPCRWYTDRLREILSKPCVCGKEGRLMRHVNGCTDQLGDFQNTIGDFFHPFCFLFLIKTCGSVSLFCVP